jgi:Tol biopolymer transport system component
MGGPWWSPQGDRLLVSGTSEDTGYGLHEIDAATGEVTLVMNLPEGGIPTAQWSSDAKSIYFCTRQSLGQVDLATGEAKTLHKGPLEKGVFDLSPDGQWLAFWQSRTSLVRIPSTGGEPREVVRLDREPSSTSYKFVKWSPDGEHLLYPDQNQLKKVHVETGRQQQIGPRMQDLVDVAIHPGGTEIAFTIERAGSGLWVMENFLPQ